MDNVKNDLYYVDKIKSDLKFMVKHTKDLTYDDFKEAYSNIPWREMRGLRNRIVHGYGNIDISVIYDTVIEDIPKLMSELSNELKI